MTNEELKGIEDIQGTLGYRVIVNEAQKMIAKADSVRDIKKEGLVEEQTLARQLVVELLEKFLSEINLSPKSEKETKKTYE